jgi:hypothetical protein
MYKTLDRNWKTKYEKFMHEVVMSWISEIKIPTESSTEELQLSEKQPTPKGHKCDTPKQTVWGLVQT